MDLLPELDINADIEALMEDEKDVEVEDMTVDDISKDLTKEEPPETVDTMFKKNAPEEEISKPLESMEKPKKKKRQLTEKQKAHLDKIRAKALASRRAKAQEKKEAALRKQEEAREAKRQKKLQEKRDTYHSTKTTHLEKVGKEMVYDKEDKRLYDNIDDVPTEKKQAINHMNEEDDFTNFMKNMDKFMILQEKLEARRKPKPPPSQPIPVPKPAPVKKAPPPKPHIEKDPYDDWFG